MQFFAFAKLAVSLPLNMLVMRSSSIGQALASYMFCSAQRGEGEGETRKRLKQLETNAVADDSGRLHSLYGREMMQGSISGPSASSTE